MSSSPPITTSGIHVQTKYVAPSEPSLPAIAVQVTSLVSSYMVWVGTTEEAKENVQNAAMSGSLMRDWACAMPPSNMAVPAATTSLSRSSSSDIALSMAQRLARRFKKQLFLSVDVPPSFLTMGDGSRILLALEKAVVDVLKEIERVT